jgi:hypothetical protein
MADLQQLAEGAGAKLAAGGSGALVSWRFLSGTRSEKALMLTGGTSLSYFGAPFLAGWLGAPTAEGLVGFLMGLFGMAVLTKAHEIVQAVKADTLGQSLTERLGNLIRGKKEGA